MKLVMVNGSHIASFNSTRKADFFRYEVQKHAKSTASYLKVSCPTSLMALVVQREFWYHNHWFKYSLTTTPSA